MPSVAEFKRAFFDPAAVTDPADRALRRLLSRYGAFVRQRARTSIRKDKGSAAPGSPPFSHKGFLKRLIFFAYEAATKTVVVGPAKLRSRQAYTVPEVLEHSGTVTVVRPRRRPQVRRYAGNPFMGPAQAAELPKFLDSLQDSIQPGG